MFNKKRKKNLDNLYDDSTILDNFSSAINTEPHNYYSTISPYGNNYNELYSSNYNQNKIHEYLKYMNNYPTQIIKSKNNYNKYNKNSFSNSIKDLRLWNKGLSGLTLNKYKQMKNNLNDDIKKHQTIRNDVDLFQKEFLNYSNSNSIDSINNDINKSDEFYINENLDDNDNNHTGDEDDIEIIKLKNKKRIKERIKFDEEKKNYINLEKKINKKIADSKYKLLKRLNPDNITYNEAEPENNKKNIIENNRRNMMDKILLNHIQMSNPQSNKNLKKIKEVSNDINQIKKYLKRNITFNCHTHEKDSKINSNFIKYLKKDNQKLLHMNNIYKQLIDSFFYFINQLSKKYSFQKEIKDVNYYISNSNNLSNMLIDLEQHLNKLINANLINNNTEEEIDNNNDNNYDNSDRKANKELLAKSKFISINLSKKKKPIRKPIIITRNDNIGKEYLTHTLDNALTFNTIGNEKPESNSLNYLNKTEANELIKTNNNSINKARKNNARFLKILNKLYLEKNYGNKLSNLNHKLSLKKCNLKNNNKENQNFNVKSSKSFIKNPKVFKVF